MCVRVCVGGGVRKRIEAEMNKQTRRAKRTKKEKGKETLRGQETHLHGRQQRRHPEG